AQLAQWLWDGDPPRGMRNAIQASVLRLRKLLGAQVIRTVADGYLLPADESTVDLARFKELLAGAAAAEDDGRLDQDADALGTACRLWRGRALANVESDLLQRNEIEPLNEARAHAR